LDSCGAAPRSCRRTGFVETIHQPPNFQEIDPDLRGLTVVVTSEESADHRVLEPGPFHAADDDNLFASMKNV